MCTIAKVVTKNIPQPPLVVTRVQLDISMEEAQLLRAIAGHEMDARNASKGCHNFSRIFRALIDAGVKANPIYAKKVPSPSSSNKQGWEWKEAV